MNVSAQNQECSTHFKVCISNILSVHFILWTDLFSQIIFYLKNWLKYEENKNSKLSEKQKNYAENGRFQSMSN